MPVRVVAPTAGGPPPTFTRPAEPRPSRPSAPSDPGGDLAAWLSAVVWALGPVAPGTTMTAGTGARIAAVAGASASVPVVVVNRQGAATSVVLRPTPLRGGDGAHWLPRVTNRPAALVAAGEARSIVVELEVPADLAPGCYRGALVALAMPGDPLELIIDVAARADDP